MEPDNGLMISLHAGTAATHRRLVPQGPDYEALWSLIGTVWPQLSRRRRRKIGFNYLLLEGINDGDQELASLMARLCHFREVTFHLLVLNPILGTAFRSPPTARINEIHRMLSSEEFNVRRANHSRQQREGGCGTLLADRRKR